MGYYYGWRPYVPVAERQAKAKKKIETLRKKGKNIQPIFIEGRAIARSFWGQVWCDHLESFSDFENRLPRGRTYVRNGSVCHLEIQKGKIEALVSGSSLYRVAISIRPLKPAIWKSIKQRCTGKIGSMLELLAGKLSDHVMSVVSDRKKGLMPLPGEMKFSCSCPDWADMCKHVAAALYGVGSRLDLQPDLLFILRGVNAEELIGAKMSLPAAAKAKTKQVIAEEKLGEIFGIELDTAGADSRKTSPLRSAEKTGPNKKILRNIAEISKSSEISGPVNLRPTGKWVARLRKKLGISVPQMAQRIGVSAGIVYRWEKTAGRLNLQTRSLEALAGMHEEK
jgi:uncharacterized Zn finger protein